MRQALTLRGGRHEVPAGGEATGALAKQRDLARVATELGDIVLHPAQRRLLVLQRIVAYRDRSGQPELRQETDRPVVALGFSAWSSGRAMKPRDPSR